MKISRLFGCAALAALSAAALLAQQAPSGFHSVSCIKIKPDKTGEYRQWTTDVLHKYAQSRVDSGALSTYYLLRSVYPVGTSAECDYLTVAIYPGAPPEPMGREQLGDALKKAGLTMSAQEYIDRRNALSTLVSNNMFRNVMSVGKAQKGNYIAVNYMKAADLDAWLKFEKEVWKPVAEAMVKDGVESGWSVNIRAFGQESDLPYHGVTVDVYPGWDAVFKDDPQFVDRFKKVHPGTDVNATFQEVEKVRKMVRSELYAIDDMISSGK